MDIRKLQRAIVDGLEDVKAQNIVVFNTEHLSALFERVIIASGTSNRQTRSLASSVREAVKEAGLPVPRMEGESNGEWIIVDCGAAVVHVMQPPIREYYHLEELWGDKPVKMKLGDAKAGLVKAAEPDGASARSKLAATPRRRAAPRPAVDLSEGSPAHAAPARRAAAKAPALKRSAARKPGPAAKASGGGARDGVTRIVGVKSAASRRASPAQSGGAGAPREPAARRATATRAPAKRAPVQRVTGEGVTGKRAPARGAPAEPAATRHGSAEPAPAKRVRASRTSAPRATPTREPGERAALSESKPSAPARSVVRKTPRKG